MHKNEFKKNLELNHRFSALKFRIIEVFFRNLGSGWLGLTNHLLNKLSIKWPKDWSDAAV